jgi:sarcosine oxidase
MEACGVPFEWLDAGEVMARWPQWHVPDDVRALYQPDGGFVTAARANLAHLRLARDHGAVLQDRSPVRSIRPVGGEIEVVADGVTYRCEILVIAADAWTNELLGDLDARIPLTVTEEQVTYFGAPDPNTFLPDRFPVWIWLDDPCFYGLPVFGEAGPKVAQDVGGDEISIESRTFEPNPETHRRVTGFMARYLPAALGPEILTKTCPYTMPPDREFVIGPVPGHPNVLVALGAAHGYKFASLFGKILSELACDGTTEHDIARFGMDRAELADAESPRRFLF